MKYIADAEMTDPARIILASLTTLYDKGGITLAEYAKGVAWVGIHNGGKCG